MNRKFLFVILIAIIAMLFVLWYIINEKRAEQYNVSMLSSSVFIETSRDISMNFGFAQDYRMS